MTTDSDSPLELDSGKERQRSCLLDHGERIAVFVKSRPGLVGILRYGSACGHPDDLTPFSDVDLLLVMEDDPPVHFVEHRLGEGMEIDLTHIGRREMENFKRYRTVLLIERGWFAEFAMKSFLTMGENAILYDPSGLLAEACRSILRGADYATLVRPVAVWRFHSVLQHNGRAARGGMRSGDRRAAVDAIREGAFGLRGIVSLLAGRKDTGAAADGLGIRRFAEMADEMEAEVPVTGVNDTIDAVEAVWRHTLDQVKDPLYERLHRLGVEDPDRLELLGDYNGLFWSGYRLHEMGRVLFDSSGSVERARYELALGRPTAALEALWSICPASLVRSRWEAIEHALTDKGYDVSGIAPVVLEGDEFHRLSESLDHVMERAKTERSEALNENDTRRALERFEEMTAIVAKTLDIDLTGS